MLTLVNNIFVSHSAPKPTITVDPATNVIAHSSTVNLKCNALTGREGRKRQFYFLKEENIIKLGKENSFLVNNITINSTGNYSCQEFSEDTNLKGPRSDSTAFTGMFLRNS